MSIRFLHTADWHLGRLFHNVHLTDDQAHILDQLVDLVRDIRPAAVLVAGDVYDRAVPPPEAVALLDDVLARLTIGHRVPVAMIAGNHDSPRRLGFGARLMRDRGVYLVGDFTADSEPLAVFDDKTGPGPVRLHAVPYAEPAVVREKLGSEGDAREAAEDLEQRSRNPGGDFHHRGTETQRKSSQEKTMGEDSSTDRAALAIHDHNAAMAAALAPIRAGIPAGARTILMAHAFVAGGDPSESERPLSVGGADQVDPGCFAGFQYVALGHLHRPQQAGGERIQYSGSLMKYSFSEAGQPKSVNVVEMDNAGNCRVERIALRPRRDARRVEGTLSDLLNHPDDAAGSRDDYLMVTLLDKGPVLDAMGRLREVYPNALHIVRPFLAPDAPARRDAGDHRHLSDLDLFESFFETAAGEPLSDAEREAFSAIATALRREQREAAHATD